MDNVPAKAFVINLDCRPERWERTREVLEGLDFFKEDIERFSAVNGYDLLRDVCRKGYQDDEIFETIRHTSTHRVTCGALGCLLSHYFLLLEISKRSDISPNDWVFIFEDDVHVTEETKVRLQRVFDHVTHDQLMIFLGGRFHPHFEPTSSAFPLFQRVGGEGSSCIYQRPPWREGFKYHADYDRTTHAYMIRKSTADGLARWIREWIRSTKTIESIDTFIYGTIIHIPTHDVFPHLFYSPLHYDSDIQEIPIERIL